MRRKVLPLMLACIMLLSVLTACSGMIQPGSFQPSAEVTPVPAETKTPAEGTPAPAESKKPEYSEITVEVFDRGTDGGKTNPTDNYYTNWIKKKRIAHRIPKIPRRKGLLKPFKPRPF